MATNFNLTTELFTGRDPDATALIVLTGRGEITERWRFGELEQRILRIAGGLASLGLAAGARILLRIGNTSLFPQSFFAAIAAGYVPIPTSTQLTEHEVAFLAEDSGAVLILSDGSCTVPPADPSRRILDAAGIAALCQHAAIHPANTQADDPAFMIYTSGTTGQPKGVVHAQRVLLGRRPMRDGWHDLQPGDRLMHAGAFNWTYTLGVGLMDPWSVGATSIIHVSDGDRPPELWPELIEAAGATVFAATPSLYRRILKYGNVHRSSFPTLRHALSAGEALKADLYQAWTDRTGRPLFEAMGMSEISTYVGSSRKVPTRPGSPGRPNAGRRIAILPEEGGETPVAEGEVGILSVHRSDPGLMLGYHGRPDETAAAFRGDWFLTGDLVSADADGYLWYAGRADDQMKAFGYRVAPEEVERALSGHPAIGEVAVAETRAGDLSLITAFVVPAEGTEFDPDALAAFAATVLADYKRPHRWRIIPELPRNAAGKLLRRELATLYPE